jgi:hypothetical protein
MLVVFLYVSVCAAEDISVLDDAVLDYSSHDSSSLVTSQYGTGDGKSQIVLDGAYYDYAPTQIDGLEEADIAAFEEIPDDLRVHD